MTDSTEHSSRLTEAFTAFNAALGTPGKPALHGRSMRVRYPGHGSNVATVRAALEQAGATIFFAGEMPGGVSVHTVSPMLAGTYKNVPFHAVLQPDSSDLDVHLQAGSDGAQSARVDVLFALIDQLFGAERASAELIAGYVAHHVSQLSGKKRARLLAEIATVVADQLREGAG